MINWNGEIISSQTGVFGETNRAFRYGDGLFETIRTYGEKIYFWEDHYFRLMASMRILRMEIPMSFTMEFLEEEIRKLLTAKELNHGAARIRLTVYRDDGGLYTPSTNSISYVISGEDLADAFYVFDPEPYKVELFKEHYSNSGLLTSLKTNNRILNVVGSIYAAETDSDNLILLNHQKKVIEGLSGNIFMVSGETLITPPIEDGCLNGIIRKKILEICRKSEEYQAEERSISPFELVQADEVFFTNAITGIRSATNYRRKEYKTKTARALLGKLNALARLS